MLCVCPAIVRPWGGTLKLCARHWSKEKQPFDRVIFYSPMEVELTDLSDKTRIELSICRRKLPNLFWEQVVLPTSAARASILFCPAYTAPIFYPGRLVVANHGIYERIKGEFTLLQRIRVPRWVFSVRGVPTESLPTRSLPRRT